MKGMSSTVTTLSMIATAGSIGGFLSISLRIKVLITEVFEDRLLNFLSSVIRMMFAMLAGIVTFILVKSNIIFGFLADLEVNFYIILVLSVASGFFEQKVPELLSRLE
jgi:hypothetical protein